METLVDKDQLIATLVENRDKHRAIYEEAIENYRDALISEFNAKIDKLKAGKIPQVYVNLPVPEDHTDDYDRVVGLLRMSTDSKIKLDDHEYGTYVLDDWKWKQAWLGNTASYANN